LGKKRVCLSPAEETQRSKGAEQEKPAWEKERRRHNFGRKTIYSSGLVQVGKVVGKEERRRCKRDENILQENNPWQATSH